MAGQGIILHALLDFKAAGSFAFSLGDGFVNVGGHGAWKVGDGVDGINPYTIDAERYVGCPVLETEGLSGR